MAPLVDYPDSESELDERQASKRRALDGASPHKALPTLPTSFYSLYATNVRTAAADDPSLHGGRKRQVAHKEGNWPTHIYLECRSPPIHTYLC
jgi:U6 snRNA phosphodiesterase